MCTWQTKNILKLENWRMLLSSILLREVLLHLEVKQRPSCPHNSNIPNCSSRTTVEGLRAALIVIWQLASEGASCHDMEFRASGIGIHTNWTESGILNTIHWETVSPQNELSNMSRATKLRGTVTGGAWRALVSVVGGEDAQPLARARRRAHHPAGVHVGWWLGHGGGQGLGLAVGQLGNQSLVEMPQSVLVALERGVVVHLRAPPSRRGVVVRATNARLSEKRSVASKVRPK